MTRILNRLSMLGAAVFSLAACGGDVRVGRGTPHLTGTDGGSARSNAGGGNSLVPEGAGASGGSGTPGLGRCCCTDPTCPLTTLSACLDTCRTSGLAACSWDNFRCEPDSSGAGCSCSTPIVPAPWPNDGTCELLGPWHTHSQPWNGLPTDALVTFNADGTFTGVPTFAGNWSLVDRDLSISNTTGADMTCSLADEWTLTFSSDCSTAPLIPVGSGCTGARRYLDWNVTLTRF